MHRGTQPYVSCLMSHRTMAPAQIDDLLMAWSLCLLLFVFSLKTGFIRFRFIFMYMSVLFAHCMTIARGSQKRVLKPLELEL